jgi:hypothetical protein
MDIDGDNDEDTHDHNVDSSQKSDVSASAMPPLVTHRYQAPPSNMAVKSEFGGIAPPPIPNKMSTLLGPPYSQCYPANSSIETIPPMGVASAMPPLLNHGYEAPPSNMAVKSDFCGITPPPIPSVVNPYGKQSAVQGPSSSLVPPVGDAEEATEYDITGVTDAELIHATDHATSAKSGDTAHQVTLAARRGDASVLSIRSGSANGEAYFEEEQRQTF